MSFIYQKSPYLILFSLILLLVQPVDAQVTDDTGTEDGTRGAPSVYKYGTRTVAMGDATVADPTTLMSININPGSLSFVRNPESVAYNIFQNWKNNLSFQNVALPVLSHNAHHFAVQVAIHHTGSDYTNLLSVRPHPEPNLNMYQADAVYSYAIDNVLSFGILNNVTMARNRNAQVWTYYNTLGMVYAPSRSISYGISFRGIGESVTYQLLENGQTSLNRQNLREVLELGASLQFPVGTDDTFLSLSLANEKRFGENGIWYKAGMEYTVFEVLALRGGLMFQPAQDIYAGRFGIGLETDPVTLGYALSYDRDLYERFHQLSLTIHL